MLNDAQFPIAREPIQHYQGGTVEMLPMPPGARFALYLRWWSCIKVSGANPLFAGAVGEWQDLSLHSGGADALAGLANRSAAGFPGAKASHFPTGAATSG